jgi:transposase InsO family protein
MPFPEVKIEETRMQFAVRAASGAESLSELCRQFGVSRPTGRKWRDRYLEVGRLSEVRELSRRPHHSPRRSSPELEEQVIALRLRYGWGGRKLRELLLQAEIDCPVQTIHRILQRHGLVNPHAARPGGCRFERERPNQLWQMDGKGPLKSRDGSCQPLSILDDHSRYAIGLYPLQHLRRESIQACLEQAFEEAGVPEEMLMDRGAQWFSAHSDHGLTALSVWLIKQGIQLIHGRPRHPQTQGKVERFHATIEAAIRHRGAPELVAGWQDWLAEFRIEYNEVRPHEALGMQTPAQNWSRSERRFEKSPAEWEYPAGAEVRRLNEAGCLAEGGRHWFVCEALAGEQVALERLPLETIVVRFRDMFIRELDLVRLTTLPLVRPAPADGLGADLGRPTGSRDRAQSIET